MKHDRLPSLMYFMFCLPAKPADGPPFQIAFVLLSPRRFAAKCKFNANVIGAFKTMSTKAYGSVSLFYNFHITNTLTQMIF